MEVSMQVFLPFADFAKTASVLDKRRLQKQGLECLQLLLAMYDVPLPDGRPRTGHKNHPAYRAWEPYPLALANYALCIAAECRERGIKSDTIEGRVRELAGDANLESAAMPPFIGDEAVHRSHRARLLVKGREDALKGGADWYAQFGWAEEKDPALLEEGYQWPVYEPGSITKYTLERK
jgi:hypothetical protein